MGEPIIFLAQRQDGLGERLRAVVNAMCLARLTGQEFRFHWSDRLVGNGFHAILPADHIFAADFLARYHQPEPLTEGFAEFRWDKPDVIDLLHPSGRGWVVQQEALAMFQFRELTIPPNAVREAFDAVVFAPKIADIIARVRALPLPVQTVGVHFRSGDVVLGKYRSLGRHTRKSLSLPEVKAAIEAVLRAGGQPIVFSPDRDANAYFKSRYTVLLADDLLPAAKLSATELGFRDLVLMSRCQRVVAGTSGFATLARWLNHPAMPAADDDDRKLWEIVRDDLQTADNEGVYHPLQSAFAYWSAVRRDGNTMPLKSKLDFLSRAAALDPATWYYRYAKAIALLEAEQWTRGSRLLRDIAVEARDADVSLHREIVRSSIPNDVRFAADVPHLRRALSEGAPFAALFLAWIEAAEGNFDAADAALADGFALLPESRLLRDAKRVVERKRARKLGKQLVDADASRAE